MGDDCKNILSKLRRRDGEKRKCKLLDVGERAGRALINVLQESKGRSVFLGPAKDRALNKLQGYGPVEFGEESGFYERLVWQELTTNEHTPYNGAGGALREERAAARTPFQRFCRVMIITPSFLLFPKRPVFVNRSAACGSSGPTLQMGNSRLSP